VLIRQRTQIINLTAHLAELGIVEGDAGVRIASDCGRRSRWRYRSMRGRVSLCWRRSEALQTMIRSIEKRIKMQHRSNETASGLKAIPGIRFWGRPRSWQRRRIRRCFDRDALAAWNGLVPRQDWPGASTRPISKQGDRYLQRILVVGAIAVLAVQEIRKYPGSATPSAAAL
jgi:transposase